MSGNTFVLADPHFSHVNITKFLGPDGETPLRPWDNVEDMDKALIDNWNSVVKDGDRVYLLGDVAFSPKTFHKIIPQLKGRICLVPGNHDPNKMKQYFDLFDDVRGYVQRSGFIMSHIPIHPNSLGRWKLNIHGHLHANSIVQQVGYRVGLGAIERPDPRYVCVSVEQIGYTPKLLSKILEENNVNDQTISTRSAEADTR